MSVRERVEDDRMGIEIDGWYHVRAQDGAIDVSIKGQCERADDGGFTIVSNDGTALTARWHNLKFVITL